MPFDRSITSKEMRQINRSAILEVIRKESPISRTRIAEKLDISPATVMRIINELIDCNLIKYQGEKEVSGGRQRELIEFNAESSAVVGVDLGGTKMYGALSTIGGRILYENHLDSHGTTGEKSYRALVKIIEDLLSQKCLEERKVLGIGVGAPGLTLHEEGTVLFAPSLKWYNYPLKEKLQKRFRLPIIVDNDVNLAALGELWYGSGQDAQNMVLITLGTGIGAGIIIDGSLYRGSDEMSGEIGYLVPGREYLGVKPPNGFGMFESLASGTGIARRAKRVLAESNPSVDCEELSAGDVFNAARVGEEWAKMVVDETIDYLAIAICFISSMLNPDVIILGGGVSRSADLLIEQILSRIGSNMPIKTKLVASSLDRRAAVMGAIVNVIHNTNDYYVVRKLS